MRKLIHTFAKWSPSNFFKSSLYPITYRQSLLGLTVGYTRISASTYTHVSRETVPPIPIPIGYDIFKKVIDNNLRFVDKSLFIKEFLDDKGTQVTLITRPPRFGKSLNLSMLHYFLAPTAFNESTKGLFDNLLINKHYPTYMQHQGHYPVIYLTLKDIRGSNFSSTYDMFCRVISDLYGEHRYLLSSNKLRDSEKELFDMILWEKAKKTDVTASLKILTRYLHRHYGIKPMVLIDEYDTPIQSGYIQNYYNEIFPLLRNFYSAAFKTNPHLNKALLTGILCLPKEDLFPGLNNISVYSLLSQEYSQYFGFTEEEVNQLLEEANLQGQANKIKQWYSYQVGDTTIYNPWAIANCLHEKGVIKPYWVNTSDNTLVKDLLWQSSAQFKSQFEKLLQGKPIKRLIDKNFLYPQLKSQESAVWSLLLMAGYLKAISYQETVQGSLCQLAIPNQEVRNLYRRIIEQWLINGHGLEWYNQFLSHLLSGDIEGTKEFLNTIMAQTMRISDIAKEPEAFYHSLMMGLTASLDKQLYEIISHCKSGYKQYGIIIISKDSSKPSIILELKTKDLSRQEEEIEIAAKMEQAAKEALLQIDDEQYCTILEKQGIKNIIKIGLAFSGEFLHIEAKKELQPIPFASPC